MWLTAQILLIYVDVYRCPYLSLPYRTHQHNLKQSIGSQKHELMTATNSNMTKTQKYINTIKRNTPYQIPLVAHRATNWCCTKQSH